MTNTITQSDLSLILQRNLDLSLKIEILNNDDSIAAVIQSNVVNDASFSTDSESDVRRTCSLSLKPDHSKSLIIDQDGFIWVNRSARIYIGIKDMRTGQYIWYSQGYYYFKDSSSTYDKTTDTLNVSCCDYMVKLDGTKNGLVGGASQITIPSYETDPDTGEITKYNTIRNSIVSTLEQLGGIKKHIIDDVGEQNAMEQINSDWEIYRQKHPLWNTIPYDLEFSSGCSVFSILSELRDLYPNYEMFFDTNGYFICRMIPNCDNDDIVFTDTFLQKILISEDLSLDLTNVRNVCEVWGKTLETDRYAQSSVCSDNTYICSIEGYSEYALKDKIAIDICEDNPEKPMLQINDLEVIPICNESTDTYIAGKTLLKGNTYVFRIDRIAKENSTITVAYLLGQWQPHAVAALVDGRKSEEMYVTSTGKEVTKYSEEYFNEVYNCNYVSLIPAANSPFTVQKIGEVLDVKTGGEYDNITSDSLASARAEYENWKNCRLSDSITIKTTLVPFAEVGIKCSYRSSHNPKSPVQTYIVKSLSHDFSEGTTTWTMYRHYPSLKTILEHAGTHQALSDYSHAVLGTYTHEELTNFLEGGSW